MQSSRRRWTETCRPYWSGILHVLHLAKRRAGETARYRDRVLGVMSIQAEQAQQAEG